jgi:hypothetical protein
MVKKSDRPAMKAGKAPKDNVLAVTDMAIAFGQGSPLPWSPDAVAAGAKWVKDRLDNGKRPYWTSPGVRDRAVALARRVGTKAADEAKGQMISETNVEDAIQGVLSEGIMAGCPFD